MYIYTVIYSASNLLRSNELYIIIIYYVSWWWWYYFNYKAVDAK